MKKADQIMEWAAQGIDVAKIAEQLGIRYQQAYGVMKRSGLFPIKSTSRVTRLASTPILKPTLSTNVLLGSGFAAVSRFVLANGILEVEGKLPANVGVYAFAKDNICLYVGVATMGLAKRLYFYRRPGVTQRTSQRIHHLLRQELVSAPCIEILTAQPADQVWNGLPVHGSAGLGLGLIKKHALAWNMRSAK